MRPGIVVQVRVNPSTAQSVIDVLETAGVESKDKSFAVCVSAALNILVETAKNSGLIPEPDPFEYANKLQWHIGNAAPDRRKSSKKNLPTLNPAVFPKGPQALTAAGLTVTPSTQSVEAVESEWVDPSVPTDPMKLMEYRASQRRLTDAIIKKELVDAGTAGVVWTAKDEADYQRDYKVLYPYG